MVFHVNFQGCSPYKTVEMSSVNCRYCFTINGGTIKAKVREQPDGSLYVSIGGLSQQLKGQEEAQLVVEMLN